MQVYVKSCCEFRFSELISREIHVILISRREQKHPFPVRRRTKIVSTLIISCDQVKRTYLRIDATRLTSNEPLLSWTLLQTIQDRSIWTRICKSSRALDMRVWFWSISQFMLFLTLKKIIIFWWMQTKHRQTLLEILPFIRLF